jgi:hypothetical protein
MSAAHAGTRPVRRAADRAADAVVFASLQRRPDVAATALEVAALGAIR